MVVVMSLVDIGLFAAMAAEQGTTPYGWYLSALNAYLDAYEQVAGAGRTSAMRQAATTAAGLWVAVYVIQASACVFVALCLRWVLDKMRGTTQWSPFSTVDLPIASVFPLIASILLYIASMLAGPAQAQMLALVAANVFMVSAIPLFVQGAAAGKGIMNRMHLGLGGQLALGVFGLLSGVVFAILPIMGLVDFWANFRRLARDGQKGGIVKRGE